MHQIHDLLFQLDISLAASPPKTTATEQLTVLKAILNTTLDDLAKVDAAKYSAQGLADKQRKLLEGNLTPVLNRVSKALDAASNEINAQLAALVVQSPLDKGSSELERLSYEREIRDTLRGMDSIQLENRLWKSADASQMVAVLRSPLPMLAEDAKARITGHLKSTQHPQGKTLEAQQAALAGVKGYVASMRRELLNAVPEMIFA